MANSMHGSLTSAQLEAYLADRVLSSAAYDAHLERKVSMVTSALKTYLRSYESSGDQYAVSFLWPQEGREDLFGRTKRSCISLLDRLPQLMEATWGVATPKGFGNCCNISVLRSDHLHYCSTCVLHLLSETPGELVLEEVLDRDDAVEATAKLLNRVYHPVIAQSVLIIREHLSGVEGTVSLILCPNAGELLLTVHAKAALPVLQASQLQAALSTSSTLRRVVVDVIATDGTHNKCGKNSRDAKKISEASVIEYFTLPCLPSSVSLRFKECYGGLTNPVAEAAKLNWMVRTAMKVMSRIPASGRRQLLEVPSGLALYTIAVGKLFDESTCVVDGHKGKAAAAWGKLKLNSLEGKAKVVRGCLSNRISSLKEHSYDMVVVGVELNGMSDDVRDFLTNMNSVIYGWIVAPIILYFAGLLPRVARYVCWIHWIPVDVVYPKYKMEKNLERGGDWRPSTKREGKYVDVDGYKTHVYEIEPDLVDCKGAVVLIAGVGSDGTFFPRDEILNRLQNEGYQLLLIDLWGRGFSDCPQGGRYDASRFSKQIMAVVENLVPADRPVYLLGMSFGGCVVVHCAATNPDRINGVLTICPAGCGLGKLQEWFIPIIKRVKSPYCDILGTLAEVISYELFFDPEKYPKIHENTMIDWMYNPAFFRAYTRTLIDFPLRDGLVRFLPEVKCPVRVLLAGDDGTVNTPKVAEFLDTLTGSMKLLSYKIVPPPATRYGPHRA
ncbi:hypothetical protein Pmar_PMAR012933 [Perkinsus marinus ATCC 50983]|uniref:Serine aminopeptidase S33 domain-containing protein n=1 Tax=Perkinsus marinus (strain ATCC 50983 / TXsc) TaxID=423536 RepID=C5LWK6_PERM5|nr:hypothetical protein Pmar_PMAR012933 [Perkinsus marinus ATCC 50983]EEQ98919.1 hypothetical protein Pmar_PMAR012933 [Perkinsus marinus ATCC 50983]|eukprot:XP_002766202.1 hypothetical protein Pmar_PMAR012933 [Perkinsus marinus ATCC 50983]